jgi:hypothetical protein
MSRASAPVRDPTHELYDQACAVLAAAQGMRAAGRRPTAPGDVDAVLDCVSAGLDAIAAAIDALGERAVDRLDAADRFLAPDGDRISAEEARVRFAQLAECVREPAAISSRRG